jgi:HTH-like domain
VHFLALRYPAWGHRKIWALAVARGYEVSVSTVYRIMFERGLVHPARYQGERRELAKARRAVFHDPPSRRNRVWQTDFSELEDRRWRHLAAGRRGRLRQQALPDLPGDGDQDLARGRRLPGQRPGARH